MFKRAMGFVARLRTELRYRQFERSKWKAHKSEAASRFPIDRIKEGVEHLRRQLGNELASKLREIDQSQAELSGWADQLQRTKELQSLFQRDFTAEEAAARTSLQQLAEKLEDVEDELEEARERYREAADYIDWWYSRSESSLPLWGKAGSAIPRHSLFGMSTGKLDSAKLERDEIGEEIGELKQERAELFDEQHALRKKISETRKVKTKLGRLKDFGVTLPSLQRQIEAYHAKISEMEAHHECLGAELRSLQINSPIALALKDKKDELAAVKQAKKAFLGTFRSNERKRERRRAFERELETAGH